MKALPKILLALTAVAAVSFAHPAQAFTITMDQVGANVVATGSGAINLTGLSLQGIVGLTAVVNPNVANLNVAGGMANGYSGFSGPSSFGPGGSTFASSSSGDPFGFVGLTHLLFVPAGYVSNTTLSDTSTYTNATFASLGVTPGTYEWTWGTGAAVNQFLLLQIGPTTVPDAGSTLPLLSFALLGLAALRRKLGC